MPSPNNLLSLMALREALAERFPAAALPQERHWPTGWELIDAEGGILQAAVSELCSSPLCGALFLSRMLTAVQRERSLAGLVDCGKTFDPASYCVASLPRLLAVFCRCAEEGIKATDLLLRDGNLPLVLLDLQTVPRRELGRIPASTWHRFQRLAEKSGTALVVMTPQPVVEAARVRIALHARPDLSAMRRRRSEFLDAIEGQVFRRGRSATLQTESQTALSA